VKQLIYYCLRTVQQKLDSAYSLHKMDLLVLIKKKKEKKIETPN